MKILCLVVFVTEFDFFENIENKVKKKWFNKNLFKKTFEDSSLLLIRIAIEIRTLHLDSFDGLYEVIDSRNAFMERLHILVSFLRIVENILLLTYRKMRLKVAHSERIQKYIKIDWENFFNLNKTCPDGLNWLSRRIKSISK